MTMGQKIKSKRQEQGFCQSELAERVGVNQSQISHIEKGTRNPSVDLLLKIARVLNCDINDLTNIGVSS